MKEKHWFQLILVVTLLCYVYAFNDDYMRRYPVTVTVIAKMEVEHTYKSHVLTRPIVGVRMDDGTLFDVELSVAQYSQWSIGDRMVIQRSDGELHPNGWRELFSFLSCFGALIGSLISCAIGCFILYDWRRARGKNK
jgi:hypothetical protein